MHYESVMFLGFIDYCMMCICDICEQISTEKEDYLIDTMALHDEMSILHPVFSDPGICKVMQLSVGALLQVH